MALPMQTKSGTPPQAKLWTISGISIGQQHLRQNFALCHQERGAFVFLLPKFFHVPKNIILLHLLLFTMPEVQDYTYEIILETLVLSHQRRGQEVDGRRRFG